MNDITAEDKQPVKTRKKLLEEKVSRLPKQPGVYFLKDKNGELLYIGKAIDLRARVRNYISDRPAEMPRIDMLKSKLADIEFIGTDNEIEAFILEANLIRKHKPPYNVDLKEGKRYPYIRITLDEPYPRLEITRETSNNKAKYYGPYAGATAARRTMEMLITVFKLRQCQKKIPMNPNDRPCLHYQMGQCSGACTGEITREAYLELVKECMRVLDGRGQEVIDMLKTRMDEHAAKLEFEKAAQIRDQLVALDEIMQEQKIERDNQSCLDLLAISQSGDDAIGVVMRVRKGILIGRMEYHMSDAKDYSTNEMVAAMLKHFYLEIPPSDIPPQELLTLTIPDEKELCEKWLSQKHNRKVEISVPQRGFKFRLLNLAKQNADLLLKDLLLQKSLRGENIPESLLELEQQLQLPKLPRVIECFDISHLGGTNTVASLVHFENAKPYKSGYRHFRIKTVEGVDDFASMREVVGRHFKRIIAEDKPLPDLVLIDGGAGQVSAAISVLIELGLDLPLFGLAKRFEELYRPGSNVVISLPKMSPALNLLRQIRDEAHRFAIEYQRKLRARIATLSILDGITGIGPARRKALLKAFGSVERIKSATLEELKNHLPEKLAIEVKKVLDTPENWE